MWPDKRTSRSYGESNRCFVPDHHARTAGISAPGEEDEFAVLAAAHRAVATPSCCNWRGPLLGFGRVLPWRSPRRSRVGLRCWAWRWAPRLLGRLLQILGTVDVAPGPVGRRLLVSSHPGAFVNSDLHCHLESIALAGQFCCCPSRTRLWRCRARIMMFAASPHWQRPSTAAPRQHLVTERALSVW